MKRMKYGILITGLLITSTVLYACNNKSDTGNIRADEALKSMNELVKTYPEKKGFHKVLQHWNFKMPSGELFEWTKDTSANKADYAIVLMSDELVDAGLNLDKMDKNEWLVKPAEVEDGNQLPNRLIKPFNVSDKVETSDGSEDALRRVLKQKPDMIKYDEGISMHVLSFGNGVEVLWAKDLANAPYEMAFKFDSEPFINAGLEPTKLKDKGWSIEGYDTVNKKGEILKKFSLK
jgi:hypothetical protein